MNASMSQLTQRIRSMMEQTEAPVAEEAEESMGASMDVAAIVPQLVLAMDAAGMDPSDKDQQAEFVSMLKLLAGAKKSELMKAMKTYSSSKAKKAMKAAKAAI